MDSFSLTQQKRLAQGGDWCILATLCLLFTFGIGCQRLPKLSTVKNPLPVGASLAAPTPSHDRYWREEQAVLPFAEITEQGATVRQVRQCRWRSEIDKDIRHSDRTIQWDKCEGVDFVVVPFPSMPMLAHTMLAFRFQDQPPLVVSVEARLERNEVYSPLAGTARQYELMYVLGDEQDLYGLRAHVRGDDIYLYPSIATSQQSATLLKSILERVNKIAESPEFYDSLNNNCTTNIVAHIQQLHGEPSTTTGRLAADWRSLLPGHSDHLAYDLGLIDTNLSFTDARRQAWTSGRIRQHLGSDRFSQAIRVSLRGSADQRRPVPL
jgi:hypothetical protein